MSWFAPDRESDAIKLGRSHAVTAEIHYSSGSDRWWYHGSLWVAETRPVRERQFSQWLQDPRNTRVVEFLRLGSKASDEEVAQACKVQPWVVREVRRAIEHADEPHLLRVYGLEKASKEEERILVTIDQELIHDAPMIPYTRTEKGSRRLQMWVLLSMVLADAIVLYFMLQFIQQAPAITYASSQLAGLGIQFVEAMVFPFAILATYVVMARRTLVLDMEIQPVVENLQDTHSEAVFLVNSEKSPVTTYVSRIFRLEANSVRDLSEEIGRFQSDTISNLQEQARGLRSELDHAKILGIDRYSQSADMAVLGRASGGGPGGSTWDTILLIVGIVAVVAVVATYASLAGGH
jgi:hypothetical protein